MKLTVKLICIILSLRPRDLETCHRNKPKYSRSEKNVFARFSKLVIFEKTVIKKLL